MATNVSQLLSAIGAIVDQTTDLPTDDELTSRISYLDQAQQEWAGAYEWKELIYPMTVGASGASAALPANFNKLRSPVYDIVNNTTYSEIAPESRYVKDSDEKYVYILGNAVTGKYLGINPTSANTLSFDYLSFPTSLASLQDTTACPNPKFLVERVVERILFSRSDPRFPSAEGTAQKTLNDMITNQDTGSGGKINAIPSFMDNSYVIGT